MTQYITAERVFIDGEFRDNVAVELNNGRFGEVRMRAELPEGSEVRDHGNVALFPGTVNAHGHSFQHLLKGRMDDCSWESAIHSVMYRSAEKIDQEDLYTGAQFAFAEALGAGITTFVDFFYINDNGNENARTIIRAAKSVGIRLVLARTFFDIDPTTDAPKRYQERTEDAEAHFRELALEYASDPLVEIHAAPHSLRAAGLESIAASVRVADEFDSRIHMHFHDTPERAAGAQRFGDTPIRVLAERGLLSPRWVVVHAEPLFDDELDLIASHGATVVYCPNPTMKFGGPGPAIPQMQQRNITVALGCDGGCINNQQSIFGEMRTLALLEKYRDQDDSVIDAPTAIQMGTSNGGDVLAMDIGEIASGKWADYLCLSLTDLSLQPLDRLVQNVVYSMQQSAIQSAWIGGEERLRCGQVLGIDQDELARRINVSAQHISD